MDPCSQGSSFFSLGHKAEGELSSANRCCQGLCWLLEVGNALAMLCLSMGQVCKALWLFWSLYFLICHWRNGKNE